MASIINATTSGAGGIVSTADASGILQIQTNGVTALQVDGSQNVTFTNTPSASSMTSLGTITLSGTGNQFSLGSLTLTSYKQIYLVFNATSAGAVSTKISITNTTGDQTAATNAFVINAGTGTNAGNVFGGVYVDLVTGMTVTSTVGVYATSVTSPVPIGTGTVSGSGTLGVTGAQSGISTASTTIYVYASGAGTKSGTITIYGVK